MRSNYTPLGSKPRAAKASANATLEPPEAKGVPPSSNLSSSSQLPSGSALRQNSVRTQRRAPVGSTAQSSTTSSMGSLAQSGGIAARRKQPGSSQYQSTSTFHRSPSNSLFTPVLSPFTPASSKNRPERRASLSGSLPGRSLTKGANRPPFKVTTASSLPQPSGECVPHTKKGTSAQSSMDHSPFMPHNSSKKSCSPAICSPRPASFEVSSLEAGDLVVVQFYDPFEQAWSWSVASVLQEAASGVLPVELWSEGQRPLSRQPSLLAEASTVPTSRPRAPARGPSRGTQPPKKKKMAGITGAPGPSPVDGSVLRGNDLSLEDVAENFSKVRPMMTLSRGKTLRLLESDLPAAGASEKRGELSSQDPSSPAFSGSMQEDCAHIARHQRLIFLQLLRVCQVGAAIRQKEAEVLERQKKVEKQFQLAKEGLRSAREDVQTIDTQHLYEIQSYRTPPTSVQFVMTLVMLMLGEAIEDDMMSWLGIGAKMRQVNFIESIVSFEPSELTDDRREKIFTLLNRYPQITQEKAAKGSLPIGSMYNWVMKQIEFSQAETELKAIYSCGADSEDKSLLLLRETRREECSSLLELIEVLEELGTRFEAVCTGKENKEGEEAEASPLLSCEVSNAFFSPFTPSNTSGKCAEKHTKSLRPSPYWYCDSRTIRNEGGDGPFAKVGLVRVKDVVCCLPSSSVSSERSTKEELEGGKKFLQLTEQDMLMIKRGMKAVARRLGAGRSLLSSPSTVQESCSVLSSVDSPAKLIAMPSQSTEAPSRMRSESPVVVPPIVTSSFVLRGEVDGSARAETSNRAVSEAEQTIFSLQCEKEELQEMVERHQLLVASAEQFLKDKSEAYQHLHELLAFLTKDSVGLQGSLIRPQEEGQGRRENEDDELPGPTASNTEEPLTSDGESQVGEAGQELQRQCSALQASQRVLIARVAELQDAAMEAETQRMGELQEKEKAIARLNELLREKEISAASLQQDATRQLDRVMLCERGLELANATLATEKLFLEERAAREWIDANWSSQALELCMQIAHVIHKMTVVAKEAECSTLRSSIQSLSTDLQQKCDELAERECRIENLEKHREEKTTASTICPALEDKVLRECDFLSENAENEGEEKQQPFATSHCEDFKCLNGEHHHWMSLSEGDRFLLLQRACERERELEERVRELEEQRHAEHVCTPLPDSTTWVEVGVQVGVSAPPQECPAERESLLEQLASVKAAYQLLEEKWSAAQALPLGSTFEDEATRPSSDKPSDASELNALYAKYTSLCGTLREVHSVVSSMATAMNNEAVLQCLVTAHRKFPSVFSGDCDCKRRALEEKISCQDPLALSHFSAGLEQLPGASIPVEAVLPESFQEALVPGDCARCNELLEMIYAMQRLCETWNGVLAQLHREEAQEKGGCSPREEGEASMHGMGAAKDSQLSCHPYMLQLLPPGGGAVDEAWVGDARLVISTLSVMLGEHSWTKEVDQTKALSPTPSPPCAILNTDGSAVRQNFWKSLVSTFFSPSKASEGSNRRSVSVVFHPRTREDALRFSIQLHEGALLLLAQDSWSARKLATELGEPEGQWQDQGILDRLRLHLSRVASSSPVTEGSSEHEGVTNSSRFFRDWAPRSVHSSFFPESKPHDASLASSSRFSEGTTASDVSKSTSQDDETEPSSSGEEAEDFDAEMQCMDDSIRCLMDLRSSTVLAAAELPLARAQTISMDEIEKTYAVLISSLTLALGHLEVIVKRLYDEYLMDAQLVEALRDVLNDSASKCCDTREGSLGDVLFFEDPQRNSFEEIHSDTAELQRLVLRHREVRDEWSLVAETVLGRRSERMVLALQLRRRVLSGFGGECSEAFDEMTGEATCTVLPYQKEVLQKILNIALRRNLMSCEVYNKEA